MVSPVCDYGGSHSFVVWMCEMWFFNLCVKGFLFRLQIPNLDLFPCKLTQGGKKHVYNFLNG